MQTLLPFQKNLPFGIKADLFLTGSTISIQFQLDPGFVSLLGIPGHSRQWQPTEIPRTDQLWKTTCFEAFLKPKGHRSYFEFNFSLLPAWNVYAFQDYRKPQPPQPTDAFAIKEMSWNVEKRLLAIQLENKSGFQEFDVSLTNVTEDTNHHIEYWAVTQATKEPDFHAPETFTLSRSTLSSPGIR